MAVPIARRYGAELDIVVVRKLGVPIQPELAMGALARLGDRVEELRNDEVITTAGVAEETYREVLRAERAELDARHRQLRRDRPELDLRDRTVIVVDDGLATGSTMLAAIEAVRRGGPAAIVVAVPVASPPAAERVRQRVDQLVCPEVPAAFRAVGQAYRRFDPVPTADVRRMLTEGPS